MKSQQTLLLVEATHLLQSLYVREECFTEVVSQLKQETSIGFMSLVLSEHEIAKVDSFVIWTVVSYILMLHQLNFVADTQCSISVQHL